MESEAYQSPLRGTGGLNQGQVLTNTPAIPEAFSCQEKELMELCECVNVLETKLHTVMRMEPCDPTKECDKELPAQSVAERIRATNKTLSILCGRLSKIIRLLEL